MSAPAQPLEPFDFVVTAEEAGQRLDRVLAARALSISRSTLQRWISEEHVDVDGAPSRASAKLREGARVTVRPMAAPPPSAEPEDIPLVILFEDEHLVIVDKPAGLVVHPSAGHASGTLVNALLHHTRLAAGADPLRPGIVHRLDKDTSGVMVVAKTARARDGLVALFKRHALERVYTAIVLGHPPERVTYDTLHGRHPGDRKRFTTRVLRGRRAITHVTRLDKLHASALVECKLETGRTHQIRVHLAEHRHPVLADPLYGRASRDPRVRDAADAIGRQALHASVLALEHPVTAAKLAFRTEPPEDFLRAASMLRPA